MKNILHILFRKKITAIVFIGILFYFIHYLLLTLFDFKPGIIIWSDAEGYYQYLPQIVYYQNVKALPYAVSVVEGVTINKYTCGTAILQAPFFFMAHWYCKIFNTSSIGSGSGSQNIQYIGYSATYAYFIWIAAVTYAYLGLVILFYVLRKWFSKLTSFVSVVVVYFGTNLFYFTHCVSGYSHVYSFFVLALFIYRLDKFIYKTTFLNAVTCGIPLGLALLIRPTNVFYVLLFLLWDVYSFRAFGQRFIWCLKKIKYFLVIVLMVFIIYIPQMLYWHAVVGKYFVYAYNYSALGAETFIYWNQPKIGEVLFSVENGWLIYSPVFFLFIAGLIWALVKKSVQAPAILILFLLILYANASWWAYTFFCGFGHRAFIEYYPLFIIPIAYLFQQSMMLKKKVAVIIVSFFLLALTFTSFRWTQFFYQERCWSKEDKWNWVKYNKAWNKAFFIVGQKRSLKWEN